MILVIEGEETNIKKIAKAAQKIAPEAKVRMFNDSTEAAAFYGGSSRGEHKRVKVVTFGTFSVFADRKPVEFKYGKTEELFAVLVDRMGKPAGTEILRSLLWQDNDNTKDHASYLSLLKKDMRETFLKYGIEGIFTEEDNKIALIPEKVECDYFEYIENGGKSGNFEGRYMEQYSWAEPTAGLLYSISKRQM